MAPDAEVLALSARLEAHFAEVHRRAMADAPICNEALAVAMNRSIPAIVFGSFGAAGTADGPVGGDQGTVKATSAADAAIQMAYANQVIVVPGYGLAVAQAIGLVVLAGLLPVVGVGIVWNLKVILAVLCVQAQLVLGGLIANQRDKAALGVSRIVINGNDRRGQAVV